MYIRYLMYCEPHILLEYFRWIFRIPHFKLLLVPRDAIFGAKQKPRLTAAVLAQVCVECIPW